MLPIILSGQIQTINGIDFNGPNGFEKSGELKWSKGNDLVMIQHFKGYAFEKNNTMAICKKGTRTTNFIDFSSFEFNGEEYYICLQGGENDLLIGQVFAYKNGYTYSFIAATYLGDYDVSQMTKQSVEKIYSILGYMIGRLKF